MAKIDIDLNGTRTVNQKLANIKSNMYEIQNRVNGLYVGETIPNSYYINNNVYRTKCDIDDVVYRLGRLYDTVNHAISSYSITENRIQFSNPQARTILKNSMKIITTLGKVTFAAFQLTNKLKKVKVTKNGFEQKDSYVMNWTNEDEEDEKDKIEFSKEIEKTVTGETEVEQINDSMTHTKIRDQQTNKKAVKLNDELGIGKEFENSSVTYQEEWEESTEHKSSKCGYKLNSVTESAGGSTSVFKRNENGDLEINKNAGADWKGSYTVFEGYVSSKEGLGEDGKMLGYHGDVVLTAGKVESSMEAGIDENGLRAGADAKITAAELKADHFGFSILGIDFGVDAAVNLGLGANIDGEISKGRIACGAGISAGVGLEVGAYIDVSDFVLFKLVDGAREAISSYFSPPPAGLGGGGGAAGGR